MVEIVRFPDIALYEGWSHPLRSESDARDLEIVEGAIPEDLDGALFKCGPDRQYPPMTGNDIFIDGEGMVHMFRFASGHVDYKSRWVRTERYVLQEKARRSLFGRYRNRYTNDPSVAGAHMGTANTNLIWHGGKLLALKEDDLPYEMDLETLSTRGKYDYDGAVKARSMTAHPKIDLVTGELLTFSYQAKGDATTDCVFYIVSPDGRIAHEMWFNMPWPACVHDFAVSESHVVFPFFPLITDLDVLKKGGPFYQWHGEKETIVAVAPRRGTADEIRWFRGAASSAGHMMNAVTEGAKVHLDLCLYEGNCFPFFTTPDGRETAPVPPLLTRLSFDLDGNSQGFSKRLLAPGPCEMPRTDDRYQGRPYRHGYMICYRGAGGTSAVGHIDHRTGRLKVWSPGENSGVHEPQFVPRAKDSPEGDGWLLVIVNRLDRNHSDLAVLDATDIEKGPVALARLPVRVRSTFHGTWASADALATGRYDYELGA